MTKSQVSSARGGPSVDPGWLTELSTSITQLSRDVESVDLRSFEVVEPSDEMARLVVRVDDLATRAIIIMKSVGAGLEQPPSSGPSDELEFSTSESSAIRPIEVCGIAFVAQLELRQCRERLAVRSGFDLLAVLDECDRTLRRIVRALRALDLALSTELYCPRVLNDAELLPRSLRVRACYADLSSQISALPTPDATSIKKSLRLAGTSLAVLIGKSVYPELRVGDRLQLRGLQYRILSWLRGSASESTANSGLQLWSDIVAFLGVLQQVNHRPELQLHDARVIEQARAVALVAGAGARWPATCFDDLCTLKGKGSALNALLSSDDPTLIEPWRELLRALGS